jgi:hypothetical protein
MTDQTPTPTPHKDMKVLLQMNEQLATTNAKLERSLAAAQAALRRIEKWHGEFPPVTGAPEDDDQGRPVAPHRSGGWHWVGPTREEAPSMSELIANVTAPAPLPEAVPCRHEWFEGKCIHCHEAPEEWFRARLQEEIAKNKGLNALGKIRIDELESRAAALQKELEVVRKDAKRAVVMALAAIGTYGRRDENGLAGLSRKHWDELVEIEKRFDAALSARIGGKE